MSHMHWINNSINQTNVVKLVFSSTDS